MGQMEWKMPCVADDNSNTFAKSGFTPLLTAVLRARGANTPEKARLYLLRDESQMHDPMLLADLMTMDLTKPLPDLWPQFGAFGATPMLAIRGENSLLLSVETVAEMARRHGDLEIVTVAGQGHAPFLETADLPARIAAFLERVDQAI